MNNFIAVEYCLIFFHFFFLNLIIHFLSVNWISKVLSYKDFVEYEASKLQAIFCYKEYNY